MSDFLRDHVSIISVQMPRPMTKRLRAHVQDMSRVAAQAISDGHGVAVRSYKDRDGRGDAVGAVPIDERTVSHTHYVYRTLARELGDRAYGHLFAAELASAF